MNGEGVQSRFAGVVGQRMDIGDDAVGIAVLGE